MNAHKVKTVLVEDGTLTLEGLPFQAGDIVEITILVRNVPGNAASPQNSQHSLQNTEPYYYAEPFEPALPLEDWEAMR
jgi:hypothetical protein